MHNKHIYTNKYHQFSLIFPGIRSTAWITQGSFLSEKLQTGSQTWVQCTAISHMAQSQVL